MIQSAQTTPAKPTAITSRSRRTCWCASTPAARSVRQEQEEPGERRLPDQDAPDTDPPAWARSTAVSDPVALRRVRGAGAMVTAPLLPLRSAVGGVLVARDDRSPGMQGKILLPPTLAVVGGGIGLVESVIWLGTGLTDTATGGYFEMAPDEATRLGVEP